MVAVPRTRTARGFGRSRIRHVVDSEGVYRVLAEPEPPPPLPVRAEPYYLELEQVDELEWPEGGA